ncbi:MAG TPA: MBL fold metallo-hydrolase [Tepidisphaeraceae bacterium]|nr:MBL fold metallo-hydrolase [Tepidisphaeraceae bacterium]
MARHQHFWAWVIVWVVGMLAQGQAQGGGFQRVEMGPGREVFVWGDTCNVYVLREGDGALLIDLGDGSVLDHLGEIGVRRVEWVLFTHHHREQCQGWGKLKGWNAKLAGPEAERALFEEPTRFRKMRAGLGDAFSVYGSSYVRPPVEAMKLDKAFKKLDSFSWGSMEFRCVDTRGNSPGGMSYLLKVADRWIAFSGDVMVDGARMHTWFDTEWDSGFAAGLYAIINSTSLLRSYDPLYLLPSHGAVVREAAGQLGEYEGKLRKLAKLYVRGYELNVFAAADQDRVSRPTSIPNVWQITKHLYKFKETDFWPNFSILIADSGRALVFDCGLLDKGYLDRALGLMQERLGLKQIDAVLITHMHGDHILQAPYLREKWGAKLWSLDRVAEQFEHPERFDYAAAVEAYDDGLEAVAFDRKFKSGERFEWEGYTFTVDWMPGQTEFGCCIQGRIDGKLVAFTGDNLFASPSDASQNGHEAVVAHNSAIFEEGYIYAGEYLRKLRPDVIVGGHSWVMDRPEELIQRYSQWAVKIRDIYQTLAAGKDYRCMFDPYWVRAEPYRDMTERGGTAEVKVRVRNFGKGVQKHRIQFHAPEGIRVEPAVLEGQVGPESSGEFPVRVTAGAEAKDGLRLIGMDMTIDGERYGEWFDFVLFVKGDKKSQ